MVVLRLVAFVAILAVGVTSGESLGSSVAERGFDAWLRVEPTIGVDAGNDLVVEPGERVYLDVMISTDGTFTQELGSPGIDLRVDRGTVRVLGFTSKRAQATEGQLVGYWTLENQGQTSANIHLDHVESSDSFLRVFVDETLTKRVLPRNPRGSR